MKDEVNSGDLKNYGYSMDDALDLLYLSKKYCTTPIDKACLEFLKTERTVDNVLLIYETLQVFDEAELELDTIKFLTL
jgi:hypothetical protein